MTESSSGKVFNVWQLFADDEHTATDGAYVRTMRARKWILLSAAFLALISTGMYREAETESVLKILAIPTDYLFRALLAGTAYLFLQYLFLLGQLLTVYRDLIQQRLFERQNDALVLATEEHYRAQADLQGVKLTLSRVPADSAGRDAQERNARDLERTIAKCEHKLANLERADPRRNQVFTVLEVAIDTMRLLPPVIAGLSALIIAFGSSPGTVLWAELNNIGRAASGG